ncbi:MAG: orotidine-5'-phosphate decarboxylase [Chloroflexota bacterium]|nr:MAG: orotidine-5'-phosphate decarboxylase [Chloroflexota bacterium]
MVYVDRLKAAQARNNSWLCVGLDPQPERLPAPALKWDEPILPFNKAIVEATADLVCAYKPNLGFYLQWGAAGIIALERTIAYIPKDIPIIIDCKTGDIGHTQAAWASGLFDQWDVDAVTVNPYVGAEAVLPMVAERPEKAVYVLARTSNPSATDFQGDLVAGRGLSAEVIRRCQGWSTAGHVGYVVGATYPEELAVAREMAPEANFLIPGVGAQGGDLTAAVQYGPDATAGPVVNASRGVIYASSQADFADAARAAATKLREQINQVRGNS